MKKHIANFIFFILLCSNVFAQSHVDLGEAFDELNYSLSVEWDQQNPETYKDAVKKFEARVSARPVTNEEFLILLETRIKDQKIMQEVLALSKEIEAGVLSSEDVYSMIQKFGNSHGTSWNGTTDGLRSAAVAAGTVVVLYYIFKMAKCTVANTSC